MLQPNLGNIDSELVGTCSELLLGPSGTELAPISTV